MRLNNTELYLRLHRSVVITENKLGTVDTEGFRRLVPSMAYINLFLVVTPFESEISQRKNYFEIKSKMEKETGIRSSPNGRADLATMMLHIWVKGSIWIVLKLSLLTIKEQARKIDFFFMERMIFL